METKDRMQLWEHIEGVGFLRKVGIKKGYTLLDFGAGRGHYTIPASIAVGQEGTVIAVEKDTEPLENLRYKIDSLNIKNVRIIRNPEEPRLDQADETVDVLLLYDVLHYFDAPQRKLVYREVHRVLKPGALLSVYPKHVIGDSPNNGFKDLTIEDVKSEIEDSNFHFFKKYCGTISHDEFLNHGCVLNFRRK